MKRNSPMNENEKEQKKSSTFEYDENQFIFNECRQRVPRSNRRISNGIYTAFFQTFIVCSLHLFELLLKQTSEQVCAYLRICCIHAIHANTLDRNGIKLIVRCAVEWPGQKAIVHISIYITSTKTQQ